MKAICDGQMTKVQVVNESIEMYRDVYMRSVQRLDVLKAVSGLFDLGADADIVKAVRKYVHGEGQGQR